ncbi:hybrid sensor histidine kinase/response regulator [Ideonella azotifigens]|uniref:histidine kinase n=2 Tax=Ideonella azotifigens TaxID=513160 RepID=A0ABN1KHC5_9BURK|nr:response regulator [Ideonella azotifigens]
MTPVDNLDATLVANSLRMAKSSGVAVAGLGVVVLVGWVLTVPWLTRIQPDFASMKPNTAVCFLFAGIALATSSTSATTRAVRVFRASMLGCVVLICLLTLAEYLLPADLGIDQLLIRVEVDPHAHAPAGRMAEATAAGLLCAALALLLLDASPWRPVAQGAATVGALIGLLACVGYAYGVEALYGVGAYSTLALHTAIGLVVLCLGALLARPSEGLMRLLVDKGAGGMAARRLLPYVLCGPFILGWLLLFAERRGQVQGTFGIALITVAYTLLFALLIWRTANALHLSEVGRTAMQRHLRHHELRFDQIIGSVMDAVVVLDGEQRIVLFNPAAEEMFTRSSSDMLGRTLETLLPQSAWAEHSSFVREFGARGSAKRRMGAERAVFAVRADGQHLPVEVSISKLDVDGQRYYTAVLRDVTELRERTEQARLAAEAANRMKSAFLANMSHEIRTPLNAIIGLTKLLQRTGSTPEQTDRLGKIDVAARHLLSVVNDIMDLSKIEAGGFQLDLTDLHLTALFDNVQSIICEQARGKGIDVRVDLDAVPLWLHGDLTRLGQALLNYASNAVKFTDKGCITLRAVLVEETVAGLLVRFEVQDTGAGVAAQALPRLFNAFEQADTTVTRLHGGSGLGLAITKHLAQLMGGEVGVTSMPGRGSTFWFTARLSRGLGPVPAVPSTVQLRPEEQLRRRHTGARILLVEDNEVNREVATELLKAVGLEVDSAVNGQVAVEKAQLLAYDLVLMDMQMPVLDGLSATRSIRALPGWSGRPIIGLSANAFSEDREMCLQAGMDDFVAKPVEPDVLFNALLRWLPSKPVEAGPRGPPQRRPAEAAAIMRELPMWRLTGLDAAYGLQMVNGSETVFAGVLRSFVESSVPDIELIQSALAAHQASEALPRIQSLKRAAGSIGAASLHAMLVELELAIRRSRSFALVQSLGNEVAARHAALVTEIRALDHR